MFFVLSKTLGFFAAPSNFLVAAGLFGIALMATRWWRAGRALAVASVVLVAILGWSPIGNALMLVLEDRFPPWNPAGPPPTGLIVLGGAIGPAISLARGETSGLNEAAERLTVVADLARRYPQARIVYSGGTGALIFREGNEADIAARLFEQFGIARERIVIESRSRNTEENARFTRALVEPKPGERWLLVTSAFHMPRSMGIFRRAGFDLEAFPVDWRTRGAADVAKPFFTIGDGLRRTDTAIREFVGLFAYRITGQSSALFPGP